MDHLDHRVSFAFKLQLLVGGPRQFLSLLLINPLIEMALLHEEFQVSLEGSACCCKVPLLPVERAVDSSVFKCPLCSQFVFGKGEEGKVLDGPEQQVQSLNEDSPFCNELMRLRSLLMPGPDDMHRSKACQRLNMMK